MEIIVRQKMEIRSANESDAEATVEFLRQFRSEELNTVLQHKGIPNAESQKGFIRSLDGSTGIMLICVKDGKVVGSLTAEAKRHPQLRHSCEFGVGILKEERRKGIGTALISLLSGWALNAGVTRLELCVFARNTEAIRLYERLGFRIEGVKVGALKLDDSHEDIIEMAKSV